MPATVVAERIGWPYSIRTLSGRVAQLRPIYLPPDPASRTIYEAGEIAQCDFWFPPNTLPVGLGQNADRDAAAGVDDGDRVCPLGFRAADPDPAGGASICRWWQLIEALGAAPRVLVRNGEAAVGRWRARRPELTVDCQAFRGTLATKVLICRPARPRTQRGGGAWPIIWSARSQHQVDIAPRWCRRQP
jgi:transposase